MLVLLDTSTYSYIQGAADARNAALVCELVDAMRAVDAQLAITLPILEEFARADDQAAIERRLDVMEILGEPFTSQVCDESYLTFFEILRAIGEAKSSSFPEFSATPTHKDVRRLVFDRHDWDSVRALYQWRFLVAREQAKKATTLEQLSARNASRDSAERDRRRALRDSQIFEMPWVDFAQAQQESCNAAVREFGISPQEAAQSSRNAVDFTVAAVRTGKVRKGFLEVSNLTRLRCAKGAPMEDLEVFAAALAAFISVATPKVEDGTLPKSVLTDVYDVDMRTLPGLSRRLALNFAIRRNQSAILPSEIWDLDHAHFSAYVDLAILDGPSTDRMIQASRGPERAIVGGPPTNIAKCGSLKELIKIFEDAAAPPT